MRTENKIWLGALLTISIILCSGGSCVPDPPGGVARRHYTGQKCGSINTQGSSAGENSRPDDGTNGHPRLGFWTHYGLSGSDEAVKIGGIRVDISTAFYSYQGNLFKSTSGKKYTNDSGFATWYVGYESPATGSYKVDICTTARGARSSAGNGGVFSRTCPPWTDMVGYMECYPPFGTAAPPTCGEYFGSGSFIGDGHFTLTQLGEKPVAAPAPMQVMSAIPSRRANMATIPLTGAEQSFLDAEPNQFDDTFLQGSAQWHIVKRSGEGYIADPIGELVMLFEGEDPNNTVIHEQSTPYFVDWQFYTADEIRMAGNEFNASIYSYCVPNSEPNYLSEIKVRIIADSNDCRAHIGRSGFIVPVEPNGFAPYIIATDGGDILVVPVNEGAQFKFDFDDNGQFIPFVGKYWLSNFRPFDRNSDGIVNYKDWMVWE